MADQKKLYAKNVNFKVGVPSLGSKLSLQNRGGNTLEVTEYGIIAHSRTTGRDVLVPWSNIAGADLVNDTEATKSKSNGAQVASK